VVVLLPTKKENTMKEKEELNTLANTVRQAFPEADADRASLEEKFRREFNERYAQAITSEVLP
jgi:hypothetical protein